MRPFVRTLSLLLVAVPFLLLEASEPQGPKPLSEADVLKLIELEINDRAIIARLGRGKLTFTVNDDVLARFKSAGASEEVLNAVRRAGGQEVAAAAKTGNMMLWTERQYRGYDNPLQSDITINGERLGVFKSEAQRPIDRYLREGWNTVVVKTVPHLPANSANSLIFDIGRVKKNPQTDELEMQRVYWQFRNSDGWHFKDGQFTHDLGPDVKDVTLSFRFFFAGHGHETDKVKDGDYVLVGNSQYNGYTSSITATVFVNGTPLNSFDEADRQLVITPLLKRGENEIKLVSARVKNNVTTNDITISVAGPAEYSVVQKKFLLPPVVEFKALEGWTREKRTGQLVNKDANDPEAITRVIRFTLEEDPNPK